MTPRHRPIPLITLTLSLLSLCISVTEMSHLLQYDRIRISLGQFWLLYTGHLSHWSFDNLFWDLLVFFLLSIYRQGIVSISFQRV